MFASISWRTFSRPLLTVCAVAWLGLTIGCGLVGSGSGSQLPRATPEYPNTVSLQPGDWYILHSPSLPLHPSPDPEGAWSFVFPYYNYDLGKTGSVNYVQSPFEDTQPLYGVKIVYKVESTNPQYYAFGDYLPATFRLFFEVKNDDLSEANGRWWSPIVYNLGSNDNTIGTYSITLTSDNWSNVYGKHDPTAFANSLKDAGWFGLTFGGQDFAGHGDAVTSGNAKFILIDYEVVVNQ